MIFSLFLAFTSKPKNKEKLSSIHPNQPTIRCNGRPVRRSKKNDNNGKTDVRMWDIESGSHRRCVINGAVILRVTQCIPSWFLARYGAILTVDLSSFRILFFFQLTIFINSSIVTVLRLRFSDVYVPFNRSWGQSKYHFNTLCCQYTAFTFSIARTFVCSIQKYTDRKISPDWFTYNAENCKSDSNEVNLFLKPSDRRKHQIQSK